MCIDESSLFRIMQGRKVIVSGQREIMPRGISLLSCIVSFPVSVFTHTQAGRDIRRAQFPTVAVSHSSLVDPCSYEALDEREGARGGGMDRNDPPRSTGISTRPMSRHRFDPVIMRGFLRARLTARRPFSGKAPPICQTF